MPSEDRTVRALTEQDVASCDHLFNDISGLTNCLNAILGARTESVPRIPVTRETMAALKKSVSALGVLEGFAVVEELKALEAHIARCVVSTEVQGE